MKEIVIGGGCFWCTEAVFQRLNGVKEVISGYAGGKLKNPTYNEVCSGRTGHAEVIKVKFDESVISTEELLKIHLTTHDPTTLNRQGADKGTQYRSVIFYNKDEEKELASKIIDELNPYYGNKIVTTLELLTTFYAAEDHHQDYYNKHPDQGYCQIVIQPKLKKFRELYASQLKD